jgi:SPP1 family predicted phage head-tail adaptor
MTIYRINAGKYRHIVTFQRLSKAQDSYGQNTIWEDAFTARVGIFPISGREILTVDVKNGEISHRIHIRYTKGIDTTMRIKFGERIFEIVTPPINFQERDLELQLMCKEKNPLPTG